ncbi:MAG: alpha-L-rhamnosidase [Spirochaetaceae bacterium]|nr:MAG: alpha-L-rhamnosidase [Spirochaetaceae bacterium]
MIHAHTLRCEYFSAPLGPDAPLAVATDRPRFSWVVGADTDVAVQHAYRLQVTDAAADAPTAQPPVWDSGWVESASTRWIAYAGPKLLPRGRYEVRVALRDGDGNEGEWSQPLSFELPRRRSAWHADFVGIQDDDEYDPSRPVYLRRTFMLDAVPEHPRLYASALGVYQLFVNGRRVGDAEFAPGWTAYRKRIAYQTWDLSEYLVQGENCIAVVVGAGWYAGQLTWYGSKQIYGEHAGFIAELYAGTATEAMLQTDETWQVAHGEILSSEIYHGETCDARSSLGGWNEPGYAVDGRWSQARVLPASGREKKKLVPQDGPLVRPQEILPVQEAMTTPSGERVFDFGQNLTGRIRLRVRGKEGERVVLSHAEILDVEGNFYTENLRTAACRVEYVTAGSDTEIYEPAFTFQGFRYIRIDEWPGGVDSANPDQLEAVVLHSDFEETLEFDCSNADLNRLHQNIRWGWKGNALDIPTDCPQRDERLGWTGDAQVFIGTASYLTACDGFFSRWHRDLAADQREDGGVPFVVPDVLTTVTEHDPNLREPHSSTGWGDAAVICPWAMFRRFGDREQLQEQYASMRAWVEYMRAEATDGLIWNSGFHFGDWVALDASEGSFFGATPNDLTATAYYAHTTGLLAQAADTLGQADDAASYRSLADRIVEAFRREFVTPSGRLAARTQTAHLLALAFNLVEDKDRPRTVATLIDLIRENDDHLVTGFLGTPLLLPVLSDNGHLDLAYELLMREEYPGWLYQVRQGATTIWEHWDGLKPDGTMWSPKMNSFNHYAYGAVGEWIYRVLGGIDLDASDPAAGAFVVAPRPGGGVTRCSTSYQSPSGVLSVVWELLGTAVHVTVKVPPTAIVSLRKFRGNVIEPFEIEELEGGSYERSWSIE